MRKFIFALVFVTSSPSHAVMGVGDIVYDPSAYAELVAVYEQLVEMYDQYEKFNDRISEINDTLNGAYRNYEGFQNEGLLNAFKDLNDLRDLEQYDPSTRIAIIKRRVDKASESLRGVTGYKDLQLNTLGEAERLHAFGQAVSTNLENSNNLNPGQAQLLTQQNTAILANIAAQNASEKKIKEAENNEAATENVKAGKATRNLYKLFAED